MKARPLSARLLPLLVLAIALGCAGPVLAGSFTGKVVAVFDGDTVMVLRGKSRVKVRLFGIDCPEKGQPFAEKAREFTGELSHGRTVTVVEHGRDQYGRVLGEVLLGDGRNLNRELVKAGLAWWYRRYSDDPVLKELEKEARQAKLGLWSGKDPVPPWKWRRMAE